MTSATSHSTRWFNWDDQLFIIFVKQSFTCIRVIRVQNKNNVELRSPPTRTNPLLGMALRLQCVQASARRLVRAHVHALSAQPICILYLEVWACTCSREFLNCARVQEFRGEVLQAYRRRSQEYPVTMCFGLREKTDCPCMGMYIGRCFRNDIDWDPVWIYNVDGKD